MKIQSFYELDVYQRAFELQQLIFEQSKKFPKEETYSLTDQIRRSSRSVGANIAEAWRKRRYPAHFASKLTDSDGEKRRRLVAVLDTATTVAWGEALNLRAEQIDQNAETQHWLETACACGYIDSELKEDLLAKSAQIGAKLGRMIADPQKWQPR